MSKHLHPRLLMAESDGSIFDHPELLMLCRHGNQWGEPRDDELIELPPESELFLLPGRRAVGLNSETGETEVVDALAVAAFLAPAHTISAHPCYVTEEKAPMLPLFAYGAVGFLNDRFYVCARRVDNDPRQQFAQISRHRIAQGARSLQTRYPRNRLVSHILNNCVARYDCPAARNFALGRYEAPLPTSRTCNARCVGCISRQEKDSPITRTPQCRLAFTPTPEEVCEVMRIHASREKERPVFSFGQGCEGDPLVNTDLLRQSIRLYRQNGGHGTVNCNTNASRPDSIAELAEAGLTSIRVSMNSAQETAYTMYYRPQNYSFDDVCTSIRTAREHDLFVSLNLLFFPGLTDTEEELDALTGLVTRNGVSMIQWRNLNIDPEWYYNYMTLPDTDGSATGTARSASQKAHLSPQTCGMGLPLFMQRLRTACPWLRYGYFNPWLGDRAELIAPMPGK